MKVTYNVIFPLVKTLRSVYVCECVYSFIMQSQGQSTQK